MNEPFFGNDYLIRDLLSSLKNREHALKSAPGLLRRTLETDAWRDFHTPLREHVTHDRFSDFVTSEPFKGLGITVKYAKQIVAHDPVTLDLLDQALQNPTGNPNFGSTAIDDNINDSGRPDGTAKDAALRRLRKDAPKLHEQVLAGEISAHAAMVQAGFRPKTFTVRADRPESVARTLRKNLTRDQLRELAEMLVDEPPEQESR